VYLRPHTVDEALAAIKSTGGMVIAGCTDVMPGLVSRQAPATMIDITNLRGLRGVTYHPDHIHLGATTTWTDIIEADLPRAFDGLKAAAREVGSLQIQNTGTIGGNICNASPAADGVPPLLTLDAGVELTSHEGVRILPLSDFITGNRRTMLGTAELLTGITIPRTRLDASSAFVKLGARRYLVISIAMAAVVIGSDDAGRIAHARIAVGACSAVAKRLLELERELIGHPFAPSAGAIAEARHLASLTPIDDVRASAEYRMDAALTLVRRLISTCLDGGIDA
jgi:CO/xanthine dehydrogenase FAD-binding subunit